MSNSLRRSVAEPFPLPAMNASELPRRHPAPLYSQIREALRAKIKDGIYRHNDRIPSEKDFMEEFGVSRITVRQALSDLEREGLIFKIPGKGSYVAKPAATQELARLQGFGEAMSRLGYVTSNRVVGLANLPATETVARHLGLEAGATVTEIKRVRYLDAMAISFDLTYVPSAIGDRLAREDLASRDIFLILENDYGLPLGHADLCIQAMGADAVVADYLGMEEGAPVLSIERLAHGRDGRPLELDYVHYRGDAFRYRLRVERG